MQMTLSQTLPDEYSIAMNQRLYGLHQVRYPEDLPLLYRWMHAEHVTPQWQLNKPELELHVFFEKMLADDHQRLYLIKLDGQPVGYAEIYECRRDRIGRYYDADEHDMGIHLLFGETHVLKKGHFRPTLSMLANFIFEKSPDTDKMIIEPDCEVPAFKFAAHDLNIEKIKEIELPEKAASLLFLRKQSFERSTSYDKFILRQQKAG